MELDAYHLKSIHQPIRLGLRVHVTPQCDHHTNTWMYVCLSQEGSEYMDFLQRKMRASQGDKVD